MIIRIYKQITAALLLFTACTANLPDDGNLSPEDKGEPVNIAFEMYSADLTKAAKAVATEPMQEGKTFRIYAYNSTAGSVPNFTQAPVASSIYVISKSGDKLVATGDMKLYRGTYYMYLVSYNEDSSSPELSSIGGKINVTNGKDFMYTTLENIIVQPTTPGGNSMTVPLPSPFIRLGSQVVVRAKTKDSSPVAVSALRVVEIKVSGLPASLDYELGKTGWEDCSAYDAEFTYPGDEFNRYGSDNTTPSNSQYDFWRSPAKVLLPVDGSSFLKFDVKLWVKYNEDQELTKVYPASIQKVLLPGMAYVFDFTLTFYGEIIPSDLTLALREYNTIPLESDGLGE